MVKRIIIASLLMFSLAGCQPTEQSVRDSIAASKGAITTAQSQYHDSCVKDNTQSACVAINKAIDAQHVAVQALYVYCQFTPGSDPSTKCSPVKSALPALQSAVANLNGMTQTVNALITGGK